MGLSRRSNRGMTANIWPGFVDAMTALLLVIMFVLTIFMIVQYMLRETITGQENELDELGAEMNALAQALGLEQQRGFQLDEQVTLLDATLSDAQSEATAQAALIASLTSQTETQSAALDAQKLSISTFETQVATLLAERNRAQSENTELAANIADLDDKRAQLLTEQEALQLALASARDEIDFSVEAARLAAARREALDAMVADLRSRASDQDASLADMLAQLESSDTREATLTTQLEGLKTDLATETAARQSVLATEAELQARVAELEDDLSAEEVARLAELAAAQALRARLDDTQAALTTEEQTRLAEAAAAETLRQSLKDADDELTAMTLTLEKQRQEAEDTLTLLAATSAAEGDLERRLASALLSRDEANSLLVDALDVQETALFALDENQTELLGLQQSLEDQDALRGQLAAALAAQIIAEQASDQTLTAAQQRQALLSVANTALAQEKARSADGLRKVAVLNEQLAALRTQLGSLQALLDDASSRDDVAQVRIETLGSDLNVALARAASEQKKRAELEEAERIRLEAEAVILQDEAKALEAEAVKLENYRSEFFGQMRDILGDREGVRIVGDRFVFSSEVLFEPAAADLADTGKSQIARVARILNEVSGSIPPEIDWIIRVDGHTDNTALSGSGRYRDNWELSQARALSVVRFMTDQLGFPASRLAATGFGEFQPIAEGDSPEALASNRRIELKLTER